MLKSVLPERVQNTLIKAIGLCVLFIGIGGAMEGMLSYEGGKLVSRGSMMIIFSFVTGTVLGEGRFRKKNRAIRGLVKGKDEE